LATYNTGEKYVTWPEYDLPLVHELSVPPVPEQIEGPTEWSSEIDKP
jgi:hypothetical protein